ncbi:hypothetical protein K458DRAFT_487655 [Lentithecium fluviatile CBS 122367]|uniref:Uncharacterized protein n=1 Tax=Lentithecium fluviatile CBS 122367 TaxID=1168545 RepID=A0A6G1J1U1_9PLEO|nr:hypothetical protein K458DRAFT_487655 [Lentithecium fluviatile CBS 122367]
MAHDTQISSTTRLDLAGRGLDLSARGLDIIESLARIATSPDGVIRTAADVIYRLGLEGLDREDLGYCLEGAKSLAYPNEAGSAFCQKVVKGVEVTSAVKPFATISSGSLGRILLLDPELSWITTSITGLYEFHDEKFITQVMTSLMTRMNAERKGEQPGSRSTVWSDPRYLKMQPTVQKFTSSIWLNIVNSGNASLPLPDELRAICRIGHHLDVPTLVEAISRLKSPTRSSQVVIASRYMLGNLSLWLIYHFHGRFRVVVGGETVYDVAQGDSDKEIELRVGTRCKDTGDCAKQDASRHFVMMEHAAEHWSEFFEGNSTSSPFLGSISRARRALYAFDDWMPNASPSLNTTEAKVREVAANLVRWLCGLRIKQYPQPMNGIVYQTELQKRSGSTDTTDARMSELLRRSPSILVANWAPALEDGWRSESAVEVYSPLAFAELQESKGRHANYSDASAVARAARSSLVWGCYPGLKDLIETAQARCSCINCKFKQNVPHLQSGCLMTYAYASVLKFVAHAIADGFGAGDASGSEETSNQENDFDVYNVERVLLDIAMYSRIVWQTWFEVASCVYLGRHYSNKGARRHANGFLSADDSMTIAIQHGDFAVVAPWIDLAKEVTHRGSFGFVTVPGRLCVPKAGQTSAGAAHQSLNTEFAVIKTQATESMESGDGEDMQNEQLLNAELGTDDHDVKVDVFLFPSDHEVYILLTRVRAGRFSRLINPCATSIMQSKHFHDLRPEVRNHEADQCVEDSDGNMYQSMSVYSFDRLLGRWPYVSFKHVHMSQVLDTYLKYNIALSLAEDGIVLVNQSNCWKCPAKSLMALKGKRVRSASGRFLIHVSDVLKEGDDGEKSVDRIMN